MPGARPSRRGGGRGDADRHAAGAGCGGRGRARGRAGEPAARDGGPAGRACPVCPVCPAAGGVGAARRRSWVRRAWASTRSGRGTRCPRWRPGRPGVSGMSGMSGSWRCRCCAPPELGAAGVGEHAVGPGNPLPAMAARPAGRVRYVRYVRQLAVSVLRAADRRLALALAALVAVLIVSTVVLRLAYHVTAAQHMSVLGAAYFTVETLTTVGYGDFSFRGQAPWLMASAIGLMLAGAVFVAVFFALLTNIIVGRRIEESLGRQRITGLSGHILVIGLGSVGLQVVQQLAAAGRDIVVVEKNEHNRRLGQVRALGVPVVIADATLPQVLESVRLASASAVAVLTSDDLANLETGLAVRDQLGPRFDTTPVVLRIFDPQFARSVRDSFGFTFVRSTAA